AVVTSAFESLDQQALSKGTKRSFQSFFPNASSQRGRYVERSSTAVLRHRPTEVDSTPGFNEYYSTLPRRAKHASRDAVDSLDAAHDMAVDEAHCELGADLQSAWLL